MKIKIALLGGLVLVAVAGCDPKPSSSTPAIPVPEPKIAESASPAETAEHGHKPGQHGGIMISLGRDSYHVEAVIDAEGKVRLYTLGKDESRVIDIESQSLKGFVKAEGATESTNMTFEPQPQEGDGPMRTSLFIGQLPIDLVGRTIEVTVPNIKINSERFRLGFQSSSKDHGDNPIMPDKIGDQEERELYLTPGGRYTAADIEANGNVTATQKFKGIQSSHNMTPEIGDRLCPITETKANPKFAWVVDGKTYLFCCPPCVDEFVRMAKESTDPLQPPESYIKK